MASLVDRSLPFLPPLLLYIAYLVILSAYRATFDRPDILSPLLTQTLSQVTTPPISLLMFDGPGRLVGQIGFPLIATAACFIAVPLRKKIKTVVTSPRHTKSVDFTFLLGALSFVALSVVGIVPLQRDILSNPASLTIFSIVHQSAAGVFFLTSMTHMAMWLRLVFGEATRHGGCVLHYKRNVLSVTVKFLCLVFCVFPLPLAFLLHPASPISMGDGMSVFDKGGLHQYCLVVFVASFYASYSFELFVLQAHGVKIDVQRK